MPFDHQFPESPAAIANELPEWNCLVSRFCQGFPQLSAQWTQVWLAHFSSSYSRIRFVKVTNENTTVGYFPLMESERAFHHLKLRCLTFNTNVYSPVSLPILDSCLAEPILLYFATKILPSLRWNLFLWERLPPELLAVEKVQSAFNSAGYLVGKGVVEGNWIYHQGVQTSSEYLASRKVNIRNDSRRMVKNLEKQGQLDFRLLKDCDCSSGMDDYEQVYSRSWKTAEEDPVFFRDLVAQLGRVQQTRLGILYLNQKPISAQLWFLAQHRGYIVKSAYDEAFEPHSPGTLLTWRMIQHLMDHDGMTSFDFLRGDEHYKRYWANERRERHTMHIFRSDLKGRLLYAFDQRILPATRTSPTLTSLKRILAGTGGRTTSPPQPH